MRKRDKRTYVLYGVADRDMKRLDFYPEEIVCMFFADTDSRDRFVRSLPGFYRQMTMTGVDVEDFDLIDIGTRFGPSHTRSVTLTGRMRFPFDPESVWPDKE